MKKQIKIYNKLNFIIKFISNQGKILFNKIQLLSNKNQKLIIILIKQARILSLIPFKIL
uniref:Small ribosomal subunit protein bS18c n=1 Tax=Rhopalocnemis phalloides TaxID=1128106 RepID=A0A3Q8R2G5_9MAGN|nr:ribosomal protein S18 [Rhopalocnemis phalloides]